MWLTLFIMTVVAAIVFSATAVILQPRRRSAPSPADNRWSGASDLLLLRHMRFLDLDPAEVARAEPLLFRHLKARCRDCESKDRCARDLADHFAVEMRGDWRDYCPNRPMLNMLSTLRGCHFDLSRAAPPGVL
jgi:Family of unknown function (DUF6455)